MAECTSYPISTVKNTLMALNESQVEAFKKFAQEQTFGDVYLADDDYAEVKDAQYVRCALCFRLLLARRDLYF